MKTKSILKNNENYAIAFVAILVAGIIFRVYFIPWDIPFRAPDAFLFILEAVEYSKGNFENFNLRFLWPLLLSAIFSFSKFDTIFDLMTITRIVTVIVSSASIPLVYLISKQYTSKKFSLFTMGIFSVSPVILENTSYSIREPLMILFGLISFYLIIKKDWKLSLLSFFMAGLAFDVKINGIIVLVLAIISCIWIRPTSKSLFVLIVGIGIFLVVSLPYTLQPIQNDQIPFIMHLTEATRIVNESEVWPSTQTINEEIDSNFILTYSLEREIYHILRISLPFLMILAPIGLFFAIRDFNQKHFLLLSSIIITFLIAYPMYFQSAEYRNIIFAVPFLCILSSIGLEGITKKIHNKKLILIIILVVFIITSFVFLNYVNAIDKKLIIEKHNIAKNIVNNLSGRLIGDLNHELAQNIQNVEKGNRVEGTSYGMFYNENISVTKARKPIKTEQELVNIINLLKIDYIIIDNYPDNRYPIFEKIFHSESSVKFLEKTYDTENDFQKIRVKVFKINFDD